MIALEEVDEDIRYDAERFYYEWLEPKLNFQVPGRTDAEYNINWRINNPNYYNEYYLKNKVRLCEYLRLYRIAQGGRGKKNL